MMGYKTKAFCMAINDNGESCKEFAIKSAKCKIIINGNEEIRIVNFCQEHYLQQKAIEYAHENRK